MKRVLDVIASFIGLVVLFPLFIVLSLLIRFRLGSPVIFKQRRIGKGGEPFWLYKFRTMTNERDECGELLPDEKRLTPFGMFLRNTSLDELPQLWNVLKGDLSLVGPRPLLCEYLAFYTPEQARRHEVKPGITGWAQINGRNAISWEEKFRLDVWYVDHQSFLLDMKILALTIFKVFKREGIQQAGCATVEKFNGCSVSQSEGGRE
ncbi:sugar transferase EpsL [Anoxybacillus voinovskiensis]|uniref:Sugar transferase EpsL n=1 Tax=Anoxybacteroides voinovskiense TaxID=230470 RepID=A0A840DLQ4_9BACL|nr:sugar transferase [Anoxybacillus voinovskiensis]MBB4073810.1 sugar transferase EpsL [Anoxybacillus voinovskiensis]